MSAADTEKVSAEATAEATSSSSSDPPRFEIKSEYSAYLCSAVA